MSLEELIAWLEGRIEFLRAEARKTGNINIVHELEQVLELVREHGKATGVLGS